MIKGNGVSTGVGFGNVVVLKNNERKIEKKIIKNPEEEIEKLKKVLEEVTQETQIIVEKASGTEKEIMSAYLMILQDPTLIQEAENVINNYITKLEMKSPKWKNNMKKLEKRYKISLILNGLLLIGMTCTVIIGLI